MKKSFFLLFLCLFLETANSQESENAPNCCDACLSIAKILDQMVQVSAQLDSTCMKVEWCQSVLNAPLNSSIKHYARGTTHTVTTSYQEGRGNWADGKGGNVPGSSTPRQIGSGQAGSGADNRHPSLWTYKVAFAAKFAQLNVALHDAIAQQACAHGHN